MVFHALSKTVVAFSIFLLLTPISYADTTVNTVQRVHALALYGEPKYADDFKKRFAYTSPQATKGGVLRLAEMGSFNSLNPFIAKGSAESWLGLLYDSLTVQSADGPASYYGLVAESMEFPVIIHGLFFIYDQKLYNFHDGRAMTADDVVFSFNLLLEKGSPYYKLSYADVASVTALNTHQVKFSFKKTSRRLLLSVGSFPILPKHFWEKE